MYSFYIWGVRRCAEKENLEWGKQVGNNRENETEIDLLQLAKALWHKAWAIVLVTLITAAMAFAGTKLFITPLYKAVIGKCSVRQEIHGLMAKNIELKFQ